MPTSLENGPEGAQAEIGADARAQEEASGTAAAQAPDAAPASPVTSTPQHASRLRPAPGSEPGAAWKGRGDAERRPAAPGAGGGSNGHSAKDVANTDDTRWGRVVSSGDRDPGTAASLQAAAQIVSNWAAVQQETQELAAALSRNLDACTDTFRTEARALREQIAQMHDDLARQRSKQVYLEKLGRLAQKVDRLLHAQGRHLFISYLAMSSRADAAGNTGEAEAILIEALAACQELLGSDQKEIAVLLNNLGAIRQRQGKPADAEALYRRALAIKEKVPAADPYGLATTLSNLARVLCAQDRDSEAKALYERASALFQETVGPSHPSTRSCLASYAALLRRLPGAHNGKGVEAVVGRSGEGPTEGPWRSTEPG